MIGARGSASPGWIAEQAAIAGAGGAPFGIGLMAWVPQLDEQIDAITSLAGLSRPKARYLRGIAAAGLDWDGLRALPDDQAIAALVALPGIGVWTAEIYLKFALGRADAFAAGDLALQEAARILYGLDARPTPAALIEMAEPWRPWRSVAAGAGSSSVGCELMAATVPDGRPDG